MSNYGWAIVENVALLTAMCFLVWLTGSGWWALLLLLSNYTKRADK